MAIREEYQANKSHIRTIQGIAKREEFQNKYRQGKHCFERTMKLRFDDVVFCTIGNTNTSFEETVKRFFK